MKTRSKSEPLAGFATTFKPIPIREEGLSDSPAFSALRKMRWNDSLKLTTPTMKNGGLWFGVVKAIIA